MSFRNALSLVQVPLAGPSRTRGFIKPPVELAQSRSLFGLPDISKYIPGLKPSPPPPTSPPPSTSETTPTIRSEESTTTSSIFDALPPPRTAAPIVPTSHTSKTPLHRISPRKLNALTRQIAKLPVDEAILQMQFSEKRASNWIHDHLVKVRDEAVEAGLRRSKMVVGESWVSKGFKLKRADFKARGRAGLKEHQHGRVHLVLKEGLSRDEQVTKKFEREVGRIRGPGMAGKREHGVLRRKIISGWAW